MRKSSVFLYLLALSFVGCHNHTSSDRHADGATEAAHATHAAESYTLYSDVLELFIEIDPMLVGQESSMLAHFTTLGAVYGPLDSAETVLEVRKGDEVVQSVAGVPEVPGIHRFNYVPDKEGAFDLWFFVSAPDVADTLVIHHLHIEGDGGHSHAHPPTKKVEGELPFTREQAWSTDFRVDKVVLKDFSNVVHAAGEMTAMPGEKQNISARAEGLILFTSRNLVQGSRVSKGELLFTISGAGMADNNVAVRFNETKTDFLLSKSNYLRQKRLHSQKVVSERQYLEARSQYVTDSVLYYSLSETVTSGGMNIFAPQSGHLHELNVSEGQFVDRGQLLATLSKDEVILLRADVPQQHFAELKRVQDASFRPAYSQRVYTIAELNGTLLAKGSSVAENDHYLPVYFEVENDGTLLEGAFVEFFLKTEVLPQRVVIPIAALIEEQNSFYVFVQVTGESFTKRQVLVEAMDGIHAAIAQGLNPGERIVTEGVMLVKTASINAVPTHGHSH